ncbi:hypothetical protein [Jiulongibacter sp. NS-SX5]|uniref:hypothetical protein n=1 Tax=Jiulongibacter sp. NS-SX5 TaxID=3463854 RepID=UPI0040593CD9
MSKEEIDIDAEMTVGELKQRFRKTFPFLDIELYRRGSLLIGPYDTVKLSTYAISDVKAEFKIDPSLTIVQLASLLERHFGLSTKIYRKIGDSLVETSFTSAWSLYYQNVKGGELYRDFAAK